MTTDPPDLTTEELAAMRSDAVYQRDHDISDDWGSGLPDVCERMRIEGDRSVRLLDEHAALKSERDQLRAELDKVKAELDQALARPAGKGRTLERMPLLLPDEDE